MPAKPTPPPELNIPESNQTVDVSIIDTTSYVRGIPAALFMAPAMKGFDALNACCYAFLIKHNNPDKRSKYDQLVFDLGVRKDWENGPASIVNRMKEGNVTIEVEKNVVDILRENGDDPARIGGIIWSHYHFVSATILAMSICSEPM
jgi:hypothetical protein